MTDMIPPAEPAGKPLIAPKFSAIRAAGEAGLSLTEIRRDVFKRHGNTRDIHRALENLQALGLIIKLEVKTLGRTATRWRAV